MKNITLKIKKVLCLTFVFVLSGAAFTSLKAEELSVVGSWSNLVLHKKYENPFWNKILPEASKGEITVQMTTHDQMGISGGDVFRLLSEGVFDVGMTVAGYSVSDAPELEGLDVPMLAFTPEKAREMMDAARPMVNDIFKNRFNAKALAIAPYPIQILFCKDEFKSLADIKGRKVRGSGRMAIKFLEALGAIGTNIAFSEIPGALERGVLDCSVTGSGTGYSAGLWEVSDYLMVIPLGGWAPVVTAMNMDKWESLSPKHQKLIEDKLKTDFENPVWKGTAAKLKEDIICMTGTGKCSLGRSGKMTLVKTTDADIAKAKKILVETVLPEWGKRAGKKWVVRWNDSVGKVAGVKIPVQ